MTPAPLPAATPLIRLNLNHAKVGAGERGFVVLRVGYKAVTLFYPPRLVTLAVDNADFDRLARRCPPQAGGQAAARRVATLIAARRRQFDRLKRRYSRRAADAALAVLFGLPGPSDGEPTRPVGRAGKPRTDPTGREAQEEEIAP